MFGLVRNYLRSGVYVILRTEARLRYHSKSSTQTASTGAIFRRTGVAWRRSVPFISRADDQGSDDHSAGPSPTLLTAQLDMSALTLQPPIVHGPLT